MTRTLTRSLLGGAAAIAIAAFAAAPSAHAACWWNGYAWSCDSGPAYSYYSPPTWQPYAYPSYPGYYYPYDASYGFGPNGRYPGPKTN